MINSFNNKVFCQTVSICMLYRSAMQKVQRLRAIYFSTKNIFNARNFAPTHFTISEAVLCYRQHEISFCKMRGFQAFQLRSVTRKIYSSTVFLMPAANVVLCLPCVCIMRLLINYRKKKINELTFFQAQKSLAIFKFITDEFQYSWHKTS